MAKPTKPVVTPLPRATFAAALGKRIDSPETRVVIAALGTEHQLRHYRFSTARYDPDHARTVAWDFVSAPPANSYVATHLRVLDDLVVSMNLAPELVSDVVSERAVPLQLPEHDVPVALSFSTDGPDWSWAPRIFRRGERYLLRVDVGQGHWDGSYWFPLTDLQADALRGEARLFRDVWSGLVRICQSGRFFDDPTTLPESAQSLIDARCGRA